MNTLINGEPHTLPDNISAQALMQHLALDQRKVALEINQAIVPRAQYASVEIKEGDIIEIVEFIGGG